MKKIIVILLMGIVKISNAQYEYSLDLTTITDDKVKIIGKTPKVNQDVIIYHFPKVIPGTYAIEDYGKYIEAFQAFDGQGNPLPVVKEGNNNFKISNAKSLAQVSYLVNDAMDAKVKQNKIFEPASTNIASNNIVMNNAGFFGYLTGTENDKVTVQVTKPEKYFGATSMPFTFEGNKQIFSATSYHHLLDNPILFCEPDTAQFDVNNCRVTIAVFDVSGRKRAKEFYSGLKRDMEGVAKFYPVLPVNNYTFLIYVDDFREFGGLFGAEGSDKPNAATIVKAVKRLKSLGVGALEHGNSSFYYLADFGDNLKQEDMNVKNQLTGAAIHEFMHILTPLSLHSEEIGNFNYADPKMSEHLWMYEGVTEYFSHLIKLRAGIYEPKEFLDIMYGKYKTGEQFPLSKMSFTEMSKNVLQKDYHKQYIQVYQRGAVLAMLLDAKIIELTNGEQSLREVMTTISKKYGKDKSFKDEDLVQEFINTTGKPELREFFDKHIYGKVPINLTESLKPIGITYKENYETVRPRDPFDPMVNKIKLKKPLISISRAKKIKKVGKGEWAGLKKRDQSVPGAYNKAFKKDGQFLPEGAETSYTIKRDGSEIKLPITVKYEKTILPYFFDLNPEMTPQQKALWMRYLGK